MIITLDKASKTIHGAQVLKSVSLELVSGRVYGLMGPNGSGKTMLMRLACGLILPSSGCVEIDGKRLGRDMDFPESVGLLIESPAFLPSYTGYKNLELLASIKGRVSAEDLRNALRDVGLEPADKRKYRKYSLGMKQRLGLAAAIMEKPDLLILDEPTNALDREGVKLVPELVKREKKRGALVLLTCHDSALLREMSDTIVLIEEGRAVEEAG